MSSAHGPVSVNVMGKTKRPYFEFHFKCMWRATALILKVPGKDYDDAEARLYTILRRMEGGLFCQEIKYMGMGRPLPR